jgi:hypothetical protein
MKTKIIFSKTILAKETSRLGYFISVFGVAYCNPILFHTLLGSIVLRVPSFFSLIACI